MIHAPRQQQTIGRIARVSGFGYWSGRDVTVEFRPAPVNSGVVFVRRDLPQPARVPAVLRNRIETPRRTTLASNGATVEMVEHILAALSGLRIDNCEVLVDRPEMPGCDGSSLPFVTALIGAGLVPQSARRQQFEVTQVVRVGGEESWVEARPARQPGLSIHCRLDYGSGNAIGRQTIQLDVTPENFLRELASSRTFVLEQEADWLRSRGLGFRATCRDLLVFGKDGPIDNELRFPNECVRHKALDLLGDLALIGCDLVAEVVAHRSGHRLNADLVRALLTQEPAALTHRKSA